MKNARCSSWLSQFGILKHDVNPKAPLAYADRLALFERWLKSEGARFPDLELRYSVSSGATRGQGCAGYARVDIQARTPVVELPMRCLIGAPASRLTPLGEIAVASGIDDNSGNLFLALELLRLWSLQGQENILHGGLEKEGVFFGPYLDILPRRLPHVPIFWAEQQVSELLKGSPLAATVRARQAAIWDDFHRLKDTAAKLRDQGWNGGNSRSISSRGFGGGNCNGRDGGGEEKEEESLIIKTEQALAVLVDEATPADFALAEMTVSSRAFRVPGAGRGGRAAHCLVPLADMLNTALPHTCDVDFNTRTVRAKVKDSSSSDRDNNDGTHVGGGESSGELGGGGGGGRLGVGREFVMTAVGPLKQGQQVHDSYGYKSNDRYLLNYGFSLESNVRHDGSCPNEVLLSFSLPSQQQEPPTSPFSQQTKTAPNTAAISSSSSSSSSSRKARIWAAIVPGLTARARGGSADGDSAAGRDEISGGGVSDDDSVASEEACVQLPLLVPPPAAATTDSLRHQSTPPPRWPVLSLLRFLAASEEETERLCTTYLRGLPGVTEKEEEEEEEEEEEGTKKDEKRGAETTVASSESTREEPFPTNDDDDDNNKASSKLSNTQTQAVLARDEFDEFEEVDEDDDDNDDDEGDDEDDDAMGREEEEDEEVDLDFAWARLTSVPRLSRDNEHAAWVLLRDLTEQALAGYPKTTPPPPPSSSSSSTPPNVTGASAAPVTAAAAVNGQGKFTKFSNAWNADVQVKGEKTVLEYWRDFAARRVGASSSPSSSLEGARSADSALFAALEYKKRME
jgi:hypothetical protein